MILIRDDLGHMGWDENTRRMKMMSENTKAHEGNMEGLNPQRRWNHECDTNAQPSSHRPLISYHSSMTDL